MLVNAIAEDTVGTGFLTTVVFNGFKSTAAATRAANSLHTKLL